MASEWKDCGGLMDWVEVFEKLIEIEKMLRFTETHAEDGAEE